MTSTVELFQRAQQHQQQGQLPRAEQLYREIVQADPAHAEAHVCLGILLAGKGQRSEAINHFREAVRQRPDFPQAHHNLGVALAEEERWEESIASVQKALELKPDYAEAHYNLGNSFLAQGRREEAIDCYRRALKAKPAYFEAYNNLGLTLTELNRAEEAEVFLRQATRLQPGNVLSHNNLALALAKQDRPEEAIASFEEALRLDPNHAEAHSNLANTWKDLGRLEAALAGYQLALFLKPDDASTHWNRSLALLQVGNYEQGWVEYEWRWRRKNEKPWPFPQQTCWDGSPLDGRTILLWVEQGMGDGIQFIRYAALVARLGGRVVVICPPSLVRLLATAPGVQQVFSRSEDSPPFAVHAPLMSLPRLLKTTLATVLADVPYLRPPADHSLVLESAPARPFRVGLAWAGNPDYPDDARRSCRPELFRGLLEVPGVAFWSLQKGPAAAALERLDPTGTRVHDLSPKLTDFADTAAAIQQLDLVISVDTATAHLAGALAKPVWTLLPFSADWRWLLERTDCPWYPTMKLFRQQRLGGWAEVLARLQEALRRVIAEADKPSAIKSAQS